MKQNSISNILRIAALLAAVLCLAVFGMASAETTIEVKDISETVIPEADNLNGEDPAAQYIYKTLGWDEMYKAPTPAFRGSTAGERLTGWARWFYDDLKIKIAAVADGTVSSTVFTYQLTDLLNQDGGYPVKDLGLPNGIQNADEDVDKAWDVLFTNDLLASIPNAINALVLDCPYELYWYDKTVYLHATAENISISYSQTHLFCTGGKITIPFPISVAYQAKNAANEYQMTDVISTITTAKAKAQTILNGAANQTTVYQKMLYFKDSICEETDYNHTAAGGSMAYGDPWQLIWVFDGNQDTKVVCEGYSKAFQYLCDQSGLDAISVSGTMNGETGSGPHMWNIATIDGAHYLVDVTNSDEGTIGQGGELFLAGTQNKNTKGTRYTFTAGSSNSPISYVYDDDMVNHFGNKLNIAETNYDPASVAASGVCGEHLTWVLGTDGTLTISGTGAMYDFSNAPWYDYRDEITAAVIESGATTIGENAFCECATLTSITIPDTVTLIEDCAFQESGLTGITIPASVKTIGHSAFMDCHGLTKVSVPDGVTTIGTNTFTSCVELVSVDIPGSVTSLGGKSTGQDNKNHVFDNCTKLTAICFCGTADEWTAFDVALPNGTQVNYHKAAAAAEENRTEPTCLEAGSYDSVIYCTLCGAEISRDEIEIAKLAHTLTAHAAVAATCTEAGNSAYWSCSVCGHYFSDAAGTTEMASGAWVIPAGHELTKHDAVAKTCTTSGNSEYWECTVCHKYFSNVAGTTEMASGAWVIPASHELTKHDVVAKTCTTAGNSEHWECTVCHKYFSNAAGTTEMTSGAWVIPAGHELTKHDAVAKTCTTAGNSEYWECTVCHKCFSNVAGTTEMASGAWVIPAGHELTKHDAVAKTCTTAGNSEYWECTVCHKYFSNAAGTTEMASGAWVIPAGHELTKHDAAAKTCTTAGNSEYWECTVCHKYFSDEAGTREMASGAWIIPAGHKLTKHPAKAATCSVAGNTAYWSCANCDKFFSDENGENQVNENSWVVPIDTTAHEWGEVKYDWSGNNTQVKAYQVCTHDNAHTTGEEEATLNNGKLTIDITKVAEDCADYTETTITAEFPDHPTYETQTKVIMTAGPGHNKIEHPAMAETCTTDGNSAYWECDKCGKFFSDEAMTNQIDDKAWIIPAHHTLTAHPAVTATCTAAGNTAYWSCSKCDKFFSDENCEHEIDKDSWVIPIDMIAHTVVTDNAVAPTCTENGLTEGKHCSVCGEVLVKQETVAALGHKEVIDKAVAATCTESGLTEGKHCSVCGEVLVKQETVAALGHKEVIDKAVAATCTESGLTEGKHCSVCGEVLVKQETVAALGHKEVIDKAVDPTCTESGLTEGKHCDRCGEVLVKQETVAALGHKEVIDPAVAATTESTGLTEGKHCERCGTVLVAQQVTPKLAPQTQDEKIKAFVTRCYTVILGRTPDPEGLDAWAKALASGEAQASQIIDGFVNSQEFLNKGLSREQQVVVLYKAMLGREPDPAGLAAWTEVLNQGYPFGSVINGFCGSDEFKALCAEYGIEPGSVNVGPVSPAGENKIKAFVRRCYSVILGRDADADGLEAWAKALETGTRKASEIIDGFVNSQEYLSKKLSHEASVKVLYQAMLGRDPDPAGLAAWVKVLDDGNPFGAVINGFCGSTEFINLCAEYGIQPGSVQVKSAFVKRVSITPEGSDAEESATYVAYTSEYINEEKIRAFVKHCYETVLGREGDEEGIANYTALVMDGKKTPKRVAYEFIFSPEFQNQLPGNEELIRILYRLYLNREPGAEELAGWIEMLDGGAGLDEVLKGFAESAEFRAIMREMKE